MKRSWKACGFVALAVLVVGVGCGVMLFIYLQGRLEEGTKMNDKLNKLSNKQEAESLLVYFAVKDAKQAIAEKDQQALTKAASGLERLGDQGVRRLAEMAVDRKLDTEERVAALRLLGELKETAKAAAPVIDGLTNGADNPEIKKAAEAALAKIKNRESSP